MITIDHFDVQARRRERAFFRRHGRGLTYQTGTGRQNKIVMVTDTAVYFQSERSKRPNRIPRASLRDAIRHMLIKRTATRKQMEKFAAFSSSMLGLLAAMLIETAKIQRTAAGLLRLTMLGVRYFYSGCERDPKALRLVRENGGHMVLMSYFWLRQDAKMNWLRHLRAAGFAAEDTPSVLLDCGAYSAYKAAEKGKEVPPLSVEEYADFIEKHRSRLWGWFNMDVIGDEAATRRNYEYLCERGLRPIPVWPITGDLDELARIVDEDHDLIGIGGVAIMLQTAQKRRIADILQAIARRFPDQNWHLLGCAHIPTLKEIAPMSADSSAPVTCGGNGRVITKDGQRYARDRHKDENTAASIRALAKLEHYYRTARVREVEVSAQLQLAL